MKRERPDSAGGGGGGGGYLAAEMGRGKAMMGMDDDAGVDELLAALGYKVKSSDMADVAQKLEQLEMAMGAVPAAPTATTDEASAYLGSDTVHYNPSDLSNWLDSMLSELNAPPPPPLPPPLPPPPEQRGYYPQQRPFALPPPVAQEPASIASVVDFPSPIVNRPLIDGIYELNPIPAAPAAGDRLFYGSPDPQSEIVSPRDRKRTRTTATRSSSSSSSHSRGTVVGGGGIMTGGGGGSSTAEVASSITTVTSPQQPVAAPLPLVVMDTQEAGIRLVHALMACAEAVQQENLKAADILVKQISLLAASQGGAMRKVAGYFAEALARRIYSLHPVADCNLLDAAFSDLLHAHFYESCPYLKFAHFTANQAILEAFTGCRRVHVIDFGMRQGMQWPALLQALALRPGGPPSFRLTGIGPPQHDNSDALQQVGWKLAQLADTIHVDFRYRGFVANSLADLEPYMLLDSADSAAADDGDKSLEEPEVVAVNSVFELHRLLALPGAVEKVLGTVRALRPRIVTVVEQEANHNAGTFLERFTEALHYYSTMFDSLEGGAAGGGGGGGGEQDQVLSEVYLGREIGNVVACEGVERTERHETLAQWRGRMGRAGFEPVHLGSNAFKQASMLLALYAGGHGYRVEEKDGCLTLCWHTRPLIATSAWRPSAAAL